MSELFELGAGQGPVPEDAVATAARAVEDSMLIVLPTDTVYGIGARPDRKRATGRLFAAKQRSRGLTLPVLAGATDHAEKVGVFDEPARTLAERFWPGGLTLVVPRTESSRRWDLGDETETIGLRVPDHAVALAVLARTGPLAVTSANLSGGQTPPDCPGVRAVFGQTVAVYLCAGPVAGVPSTVLDLSGDEPRVIREGSISSKELHSLFE